MINVIPLIAKKYNRKGDTSGSLKSLVDDMVFITDKDDLLLFASSITNETKYSFEEIADVLILDDKYNNVLNIILGNLNADLDYHNLFLKAIKSESYEIICTINNLIQTQDLFLSKNNNECLFLALDKSFVIFDKVLGIVITQMRHTRNMAGATTLLGILMTKCIINKDINKLSSLCTGHLAIINDESKVKDLMNKSAMTAFQYMSEEDIHIVVDDINSRMVLSRYLSNM